MRLGGEREIRNIGDGLETGEKLLLSVKGQGDSSIDFGRHRVGGIVV